MRWSFFHTPNPHFSVEGSVLTHTWSRSHTPPDLQPQNHNQPWWESGRVLISSYPGWARSVVTLQREQTRKVHFGLSRLPDQSESRIHELSTTSVRSSRHVQREGQCFRAPHPLLVATQSHPLCLQPKLLLLQPQPLPQLRLLLLESLVLLPLLPALLFHLKWGHGVWGSARGGTVSNTLALFRRDINKH